MADAVVQAEVDQEDKGPAGMTGLAYIIVTKLIYKIRKDGGNFPMKRRHCRCDNLGS